MSAIVVSDIDENWFTNSYSWSIILDLGMARLDAEKRDEYEWFANTIGMNFTSIDASKRREAAEWLLGVVDDLQGPLGAEYNWDTEKDRSHLAELSTMLRGIIHRQR
jgi:hypothetical protein